MHNCPKGDVAQTVSSEEYQGNMSKPNMVLDATLRGETKQWQQARTTSHRKKHEHQTYVPNNTKH